MITTVLFDIGNTLVVAADPGTPVTELVARPYPGVVRTLRALAAHGIRLGAVTDTATMCEADVRAALGDTGLSDLLEVIITSADLGVAKPAPDGLVAALAALDGKADEAVFVGDSEVDRSAAAAAGTGFVPVSTEVPLPDALRAHLVAELGPFEAARVLVGPADAAAAEAAWAHQAQLTKPAGALGRLESLAVQLAALAGEVKPPTPKPAAIALFAGDHGVLAQGVTHWPREVTAQMVANIAAGGAAINALARQAGASVTVVDVGVATDLLPVTAAEGVILHERRIRPGTGDLAVEPAMTDAELQAALDLGAEIAAELVAGGARALVTGEMGIGNTTPSAAVIAALTGRSPAEVTGRGTGVDDETLAKKVAAIEAGLARLDPGAGARRIAAEVGGLELVALAGLIVGGASAGVPVVVDGVIAGAALLIAHALCPEVLAATVAGHCSVEPGSSAVLAHLGLVPVLDLGLRLGEGSGAALALGVLEAAVATHNEMATFADAGIG